MSNDQNLTERCEEHVLKLGLLFMGSLLNYLTERIPKIVSIHENQGHEVGLRNALYRHGVKKKMVLAHRTEFLELEEIITI